MGLLIIFNKNLGRDPNGGFQMFTFYFHIIYSCDMATILSSMTVLLFGTWLIYLYINPSWNLVFFVSEGCFFKRFIIKDHKLCFFQKVIQLKVLWGKIFNQKRFIHAVTEFWTRLKHTFNLSPQSFTILTMKYWVKLRTFLKHIKINSLRRVQLCLGPHVEPPVKLCNNIAQLMNITMVTL